VGMSDILAISLAVVLTAAFAAAYLGIVVWAIGDAQKRGQSGCLFLFLFWLFGPFAALVWLIVRPSTTVEQRPHDDYTNAEDALAAASRLDQLGEWHKAISLYESAAHRWPEHKDYAFECQKRVKAKLSPD